MPIFHTKEGPGIFYVHVPKTGGTYIEQLFKANGYSTLFWSAKPRARGLLCSPQHFHREIYRHFVDLESGKPSFMTVRHPVDRLLSEFHATIRRGAWSGNLSAWLGMVNEGMAASPFAFDNHLRPQHEFHDPALTVFRQEEGFDADWTKALDERYGLGFTCFQVDPRRPVSETRTGLESTEKTALLNFCEERYKIDFTLFGYDPETARCLT